MVSTFLSYNKVVRKAEFSHLLELEKVAEKINSFFVEKSVIVKNTSLCNSIVEFVDKIDTRDTVEALNKSYSDAFRDTVKNITKSN